MKYFTRISICVINRTFVGTLPSGKYTYEYFYWSDSLVRCGFSMKTKLSRIGNNRYNSTKIK